MRASECRSCGEPMLWVVGPSGKAMPLDADEDGDPLLVNGGNLAFSGVVEGDGKQHVVYVKPRNDVRAMRSHFATCEQADAWRKGKAKR